MNWYDYIFLFLTIYISVGLAMTTVRRIDATRRKEMAETFIEEIEKRIATENQFIDIVSKYEEDGDRP
jgi:hypothetical protein